MRRRTSSGAARPAFPKLTITNANDAREARAHELASALMSGADVSRGVAAARASGAAGGGSPADPPFEAAVHAANAAGRPLETAARAPLERATGFDFGTVRVHADACADRLARSIGALAFTTGNHVYFRSDAYAPRSALGRALLTHELAHVMQPAAPGLVQRAEDGPSVRQRLASAAHGARGVAKRSLGIGREARINRYLSAAAAEIDEWRTHYADYEQSAQPLRQYRYQQWLQKHGNLAQDATSWNPIHAETQESEGKKRFETVSEPYEQSVIETYAHAVALVYARDYKNLLPREGPPANAFALAAGLEIADRHPRQNAGPSTRGRPQFAAHAVGAVRPNAPHTRCARGAARGGMFAARCPG
jgi:hypothetical protein